MTSASVVPALVTLQIWGVASPAAAVRLVATRRPRPDDEVSFARVLGTGSGRTFTARDADPKHWAVLRCWRSEVGARSARDDALTRAWDQIATERAVFELVPVSSRGEWSGRSPFGDPQPHRHEGPIAAITRARIRPRHWSRFWRAVPPVSAAAHHGDGMTFALGIGEAPVGLQGTFSVWSSAAALNDFAYRRPEHRAAVEATNDTGWYAEDLFARFVLRSARGHYEGSDVAHLTGGDEAAPGRGGQV